MDVFLECFITIFVVGNALPLVPLYLGLTSHLDRAARRRLAIGSIATGAITAGVLAVLGSPLLDLLQVSVDDIRIAGGLILLVFATHDILFSRERRKRRPMSHHLEDMEELEVVEDEEDEVGVVPIGVPLIVGPGTIATVIALSELNGLAPTLGALGANAALNLGLLIGAVGLQRLLGPSTMRVVGKVMSLLLAAIAVSMLRAGIIGAFGI